MISNNTDKVIDELFESLLNRYQIGLETSIQGGYFISDCVHCIIDVVKKF